MFGNRKNEDKKESGGITCISSLTSESGREQGGKRGVGSYLRGIIYLFFLSPAGDFFSLFLSWKTLSLTL